MLLGKFVNNRWPNRLPTFCLQNDSCADAEMCCSVYETYYQKELLHEYTPSAISWIGSLQVFLQFAAGIIAGPITDLWGPRVRADGQVIFPQRGNTAF